MTAIALCAGQATAESDIWYSDTPEDVELAKRACGRCLLRLSCLAGALAREEPEGIWGGLTAAERLGGDGFFLMWSFEMAHGKREAYTAGCRCPECCRANTEYVAEYRAIERPAPVTAHDTLDQQMQMHLFEGAQS